MECLLTVSVLKACDGTVLGYQGIIRDVSERKRMQEAIRESEERLRYLFERAPIGIFQSTPDGRLLQVNETYARMFGFPSPEEAVSSVKNIAMDLYVHPERRGELVERLSQSDQVLHFENEYRRRDGTIFTGNLHMRTVRGVEGSVRYFEGFFEDISERKRSEEALRESEERYRKLVEVSSEAIILRFEDVIHYVNPAAVRLLHATTAENLLGRSYLSLVHPEDRSGSAERVGRSIQTHWVAPPRKHRLVALDGKVIHVESTGVPYQDQGRVMYWGFSGTSPRENELKRKSKPPTSGWNRPWITRTE